MPKLRSAWPAQVLVGAVGGHHVEEIVAPGEPQGGGGRDQRQGQDHERVLQAVSAARRGVSGGRVDAGAEAAAAPTECRGGEPEDQRYRHAVRPSVGAGAKMVMEELFGKASNEL